MRAVIIVVCLTVGCVVVLISVLNTSYQPPKAVRNWPHHDITKVVLKNGLNCVFYKGYNSAMSCNWELWNRETNFGEYPYATNKEAETVDR